MNDLLNTYGPDPYGPINPKAIAMGEGDMEPVGYPSKPEPDKHAKRKAIPLFSGLMSYFPMALCEVAKCSQAGSEQHHPGKPLHWDRAKSSDEPDALLRHLLQYDQLDDDGMLHAAKVAWRALALLEKTIEARGEDPLS